MSEFFISRHSKANYDEYDKVLKSDNPQAPFEHRKQVGIDLTPEGVKLAQEKASELLSQFNSEVDSLFFVTSNEARAIGTADIYRQEAHKMGFEVIKPVNPEVKKRERSPLAETVGKGELRVLDTLSLNSDNTLRFLIFSASEPEVNWSAVDNDFQDKWHKARAIIQADNRGSWGANFQVHSQEIKKIFPNIETAQGFYDTKFKDVIRLSKWADRKIENQTEHKSIKVLAFSHEDYLTQFLNTEFGAEGIKNCEVLKLNVEDSEDGVKKISTEFRGQKVNLE